MIVELVKHEVVQQMEERQSNVAHNRMVQPG